MNFSEKKNSAFQRVKEKFFPEKSGTCFESGSDTLAITLWEIKFAVPGYLHRTESVSHSSHYGCTTSS